MIPKIIISMWVGPEMPDLVKKCTATHKLEGYEHVWIDNGSVIDEEFKTEYFHECIAAGQWGKLSDYLRICYLEKYGGIYLDADTEVLRDFDDVLDAEIFACEEENMFVANGIIGAVPHHPMMVHYKKLIEDNFRGTGDLVFQPGMYLWTELVKYSQWTPQVKLYSPEWFLPYNHQTGVTNVTVNTHTTHYYLKSWLKHNQICPLCGAVAEDYNGAWHCNTPMCPGGDPLCDAWDGINSKSNE